MYIIGKKMKLLTYDAYIGHKKIYTLNVMSSVKVPCLYRAPCLW